MKKLLKIALIVICILIVILIAAMLFLPKHLAVMVYNENFAKRFTSYEPLTFDIDDFDSLQRVKYTFPSNNGQMLNGYRYDHADVKPQGVVVLAHGFGGGGHRSYMNIADWFTANGYAVFAYDATGNDESEGDVVGGLPQGLIDLDYALRFIKVEPDFYGLPIMLWGHSWGGYSVGSVLALHPDIKAAVIVAGFNASIVMLECEGRNIAGDAIDLLLPALEEHEKEIFGTYASMNVLDGLASSDAKVMILHSADDSMIPIDMSYDRYYAAYGDDDRFTFIRYEDRGHNYLFCSEARRSYVEAYNAEANAYVELHGPHTEESRAAYYEEHFDKHKGYELDNELMSRMLALYNSSIQ